MHMGYLAKKYLHLPKRKESSHKGDNGKVLVIGGSEEYVGAVALAGIAALRSGCDWVTIAAPEKVAWAVNCLYPDLVVKKVKGKKFTPSHLPELLRLAEKHDVILLGNGIGLESRAFVKGFIKKIRKPMVIDADALKVISLDDVKDSVLTPHKGEFHALLRNTRIQQGKLLKHLGSNVIIIKGRIDHIISKKGVFLNKTGNAGMTKAGTGDVLAGLCAGFFAQNKNLLEAAKLAAFYNGYVGDILLKKKKGFTFLASDMAKEIRKLALSHAR